MRYETKYQWQPVKKQCTYLVTYLLHIAWTIKYNAPTFGVYSIWAQAEIWLCVQSNYRLSKTFEIAFQKRGMAGLHSPEYKSYRFWTIDM